MTWVAKLTSRRTISKNLNKLINDVAAKHGTRVVHAEHYDFRVRDPHYVTASFIDRNGPLIWFKQHGNQYAGYVEFWSSDVIEIGKIAGEFERMFPNAPTVKEEYAI